MPIDLDETLIVFTVADTDWTTQAGESRLWTVRPDGSELNALEGPNGMDEGWWQPGTSRIAYMHIDDTSNPSRKARFSTADPDGSNRTTIMVADETSPLIESCCRAGNPIWSPDGTKIVFWAKGSDMLDIFVMDADGSNMVNLTASHPPRACADDSHPVWSPSGDKIAYRTQTACGPGLVDYEMNPDGTNPVPSGNYAAWDVHWSPDNSKKVYSDSQGIWVQNADGSGSTLIVPVGIFGSGKVIGAADWSHVAIPSIVPATINTETITYRCSIPDQELCSVQSNGSSNQALTDFGDLNCCPAWGQYGQKIYSVRTTDKRLYVSDASGNNMVMLLDPAEHISVPAVSRNGDIAFAMLDGSDYDIFIRYVDGSVVRVTTNSGDDKSPSWSPDGTQIVYIKTATPGGTGQVATMNADGTGSLQLTFDANDKTSPSWSPAGDSIAFVSGLTGDDEIYVMGTDGTRIVNLTNNASTDEHPTWSPEGDRLAFVSNRDGDRDIYLMNNDGSGVTQLVNQAGEDREPDWGYRSGIDTVPGTPTGIVAVGGDGQATVSWSAPSSDGGSAITTYTVTASPGGATTSVSAPSTTAAVTGLTNGTPYTFTVVAANAVGASVASAASSSVTPLSSSRIAFGGNLNGSGGDDINLIDPDGANWTVIWDNTGNTNMNGWLTWSPDGTKIAWLGDLDGGGNHLNIVNADGSSPAEIWSNPGGVSIHSLAWSPDGSRIAFGGNLNGSGGDDINLIDPDGANWTVIWNNTGNTNMNGWLTWSNDGTKIAWAGDLDGGQNNINVINADGSSPTEIWTNAGGVSLHSLAWSHDGNRIAFGGNLNGDGGDDINLIDPDGANWTVIWDNTANSGMNGWLTWSPDSAKLAWLGDLNGGGNHLNVIDSDGSDAVEAWTNTDNVSVHSLAWSPTL